MASVPIKDQKKIKEMFEALASRQNGEVYTLYFEFALSTALRVSDILSLRKRNIRNGYVHVKTMKTGMERVIVLNKNCRKRMDSYLKTKKDDDLIFPFKRQWVHKLLKWAADFAGLDPRYISCHSTRKTAAWRFYIDSNHDIMKTMYLLGHKSPKETRFYLGINDEEVNHQLINVSWR
ncbi:tyrosine-type recombinase/integrase [Sporolactobacillus shoreicorticis]|uniref:Tyrosine-type recombinase/integrase n=1 Tax=Sporolactobacillus shoreicorticis TaxID=1923877 RepID=A0ABW5RZP6_9BACL|nr:tyrosine-type recombinase/integrase [Sporolactobacillus shoreicorticis]MCO7128420.1 tyrosine-type recombinase/integrase [Sporolactobacillus shoreicorticis]